jgi:hypothetical protein
VVVADPRTYRGSLAEVGRVIASTRIPATVLGGFAIDARGAEMLRGQWSGRLDRTLLIRSARELAGNLAARVGMPPAVPPPPRLDGFPTGNPAEQGPTFGSAEQGPTFGSAKQGPTFGSAKQGTGG